MKGQQKDLEKQFKALRKELEVLNKERSRDGPETHVFDITGSSEITIGSGTPLVFEIAIRNLLSLFRFQFINLAMPNRGDSSSPVYHPVKS